MSARSGKPASSHASSAPFSPPPAPRTTWEYIGSRSSSTPWTAKWRIEKVPASFFTARSVASAPTRTTVRSRP
jgi:hypothetical protein